MRFEITEEFARVLDENLDVVAEAAADLVAKQYFSQGKAKLGLLPAAIRWISNDNLSVILERPPQIVEACTIDGIIKIPLPWIVWGVRLNIDHLVEKSYLFARNRPIFTEQDELYALPMPNMSRNSQVALPSNNKRDTGLNIARAIIYYWGRPMNDSHNEMLNSEDMLPAGWDEHTHSAQEFLNFLATMTIEEMNFTEFRPAVYATVTDLIALLDAPMKEKAEKSVTELLADIVIDATKA